MKNLMKLFVLTFFATTVLVSCSKDDDPADNDLFVGTYRGSVSYTNGDESHSNENGNVRVVKAGNNYNFIFSDGIPDLTGVEFRREDDNTVISIGDDESKYIRITASSLRIIYIKDGGATWDANCTR